MLLLDLGGVVFVPDAGLVHDTFAAAGITADRSALPLAHYHGVAALDRWVLDHPSAALDGGGPLPAVYFDGFVTGAGVGADQRADAVAALGALFTRSSIEVWSGLAPRADEGLRVLADRPVRVGVVSNSDGTAAAQLARHGLAQVGAGPGLAVEVIVDSHVVGVAKPDPGVFDHALGPMDVDPSDCWYVGDTITYDVTGARAAGLRPLHVDPLGACAEPDGHAHAGDLLEAVAALAVVEQGR